MKTLRNLMLAAMATLMLCLIAACGRKATFLESKVTNIEVDAEAYTDTVALLTDGGDISVKAKPDWIMTKMDGNVLTYAVAENSNAEDREGDIVLACDECEYTIHVAQVTPATCLVPNPTSLGFRSSGGTATVKVDTDAKTVKVEAPQGFETQYADGTLTVTAAAGAAANGGEVVLKAGKLEARLAINQLPDYCTRCGGSGRMLCPECKGIDYEYTNCCTCDMRHYITCTKCGGTGR